MTPKEAIRYLLALNRGGAKFGLERMRAFADALGNPEQAYPIIHVAGTNGKGSTCALLERVYREAGYKTGMFTSPHLTYIGERMQVAGVSVDPVRLAQLVARHSAIVERIASEEGGERPTYFEFMTGMAFSYFREDAVDIAIIEVGLGGRLDSTNVLKPSISVITSISKDHCEQLGDTIEAIAREKAGIIKHHCPVVIGELPEAAEAVIRSIALERDAPVYSIRERFRGGAYPRVGLKASYQRKNAAVAQLVTEVLNVSFPVTEDERSRAFRSAFWPGRWQEIVLSGGPTLILESAHNEEGAQMLAESLDEWKSQSEGLGLTVIFGSLGVDRAKSLLDVIVRYAQKLILVEPDQPRALSVETLRLLVPSVFSGDVIEGKLEHLFGQGSDGLKGEVGDVFLATGSIYLVGEILGHLEGVDAASSVRLQDCLSLPARA